MSEWSYFHPTRIEYGENSLATLPSLVGGNRLALVTSPGFTRRGISAGLQDRFGGRLIKLVDTVKPNPDLEDIDQSAGELKELQIDGLIALGGGSSIDTAKALARILGSPDNISLVEHFRMDKPLAKAKALPIVAIPTTAGTGAEVTPFGTVWDFKEQKKYSVLGPDLYPELALLDPALTLGLPDEVTVSSGLDAISHSLESTWNRHASPISLSFASRSLMLALPALPVLKKDLSNMQARSAMLQASTLAGLAISQTRTALAHSISYPLTSSFDLPHGLACSFTLPALLRFNAKEDDGRLAQLARTLGFASALNLADHLQNMFLELGLADLMGKYIGSAEQVYTLQEKMFHPDRAGNNMRTANAKDVEEILRGSLDAICQ